tara:strand:- start:309 stop:656 length:348 start_codon:yes stop_codon:yes gene_type:complete
MALDRDKRMKMRDQFIQRRDRFIPDGKEMDTPQGGPCDNITNRLARLKCQLKNRQRPDLAGSTSPRNMNMESPEDRHRRLFNEEPRLYSKADTDQGGSRTNKRLQALRKNILDLF